MKVKIKIEFEVKETGKYESFETMLEEKESMYGEHVCFTNDEGIKYVYAIGSMKIFKSIGNVLRAEGIELNWLNVEYKFE